MKGIILYVDRSLAIAIAANLVGVLNTKGQSRTEKVGFNWLVSAGQDDAWANTSQLDIREMLPEDLVYYFYNKIPYRYENLESLLPKLTVGTSDSLLPGNVVSVKGSLFFPNLTLNANNSPFEEVELDVKKHIFHGEECIVAELKNGDYKIPVYLPYSSRFQVLFCQNQPVELTGVVRWIPSYNPNGSRSINLALRCAVVWLK